MKLNKMCRISKALSGNTQEIVPILSRELEQCHRWMAYIIMYTVCQYVVPISAKQDIFSYFKSYLKEISYKIAIFAIKIDGGMV